MRLEAESIIASEIHKFVMNGGLYRGTKTVMWSPVEKTSLAEAEIEYKDHKSVTVWVRFPVMKQPVFRIGRRGLRYLDNHSLDNSI